MKNDKEIGIYENIRLSKRLENSRDWISSFILIVILCGSLLFLVHDNFPAYADEVNNSEFPTRTCPSCNGSSGFYATCDTCQGSGYSAYLDGKPYKKCSKCDGAGSVYVSCDLCHETKTVTGFIVTYAYAGFTSKKEVVCERAIELPTRPDVLYDQKYTKFLHWATQRNGCKIFMPGDVVSINSDLTFYEVRAIACDTCKGKGVSTTTLDCAACGGSGNTYGTTTCLNGADGLKPEKSSVMCPNCSGIGHVIAGNAAGSVVVCPACDGERFITVTTRVYCDRCFGTGKETTSSRCAYCNNGTYDYSRSCKSCNGEGIKEQPIIKHNVVVDTPAKDATCTENGCTQGTHCSECEKVIKSSDAIPSRGHQLEATDEIRPTCLDGGVTAGRTCIRCDYFEGFEPIEALGHDLVDTEEIEATCLKGGITNGRMCTRCDYAEGNEQTAPLGHDLQYAPAQGPTCTTPGATEGYRCNRCGYEEGIHALDPIGHSLVITKSSISPTCDKEGRTAEKTCKNCSYTEMPASIPAKGHTYEYLAETPASCVMQGISEGSMCVECGHTEGREPIAALGHALKSANAIAPTCTTEGQASGKECSRCSYQEGLEKIAPLGHDLVHYEFVQPTCVRDGVQAGDRCKRCDYKVGTDPIKALGHNLIQISYSAPTCITSGIEAGEVCSKCDYLKGATVIPAKGHSWKDPVWFWNDTRDEASATFECQNDSHHNEILVATISDATGETGLQRIATVVHDGKTFTDSMVLMTGNPVTAISLSEAAKVVIELAPFVLVASVTPEDAFNGAIAWSSSDTSVATVDASGIVTPLRAGTTVISASAGGMSAQCLVTVTEPNVPIVPAESIMLSSNEVTLTGKSTAELSATVMPENATYKAVAWSSSNEKVVRVDAKGMLTAVGKGTATVMATSQDGAVTATCQVAVLNPATKISVDAMPIEMKQGKSYDVKANVTGDLSGETDAVSGFTWSVSDTNIATVSGAGNSARITCVGVGEASLRVEATLAGGTDGPSGITFLTSFVVTLPNPESIALSESAKVVVVGDPGFTLTTTIAPMGAAGNPVSWASTNADVASVDGNGAVKVLRAGQTSITARAGNVSASCLVTVEARSFPAAADSEFDGYVLAIDSSTAEKLEGMRVRINESERSGADDVRYAAIASSGAAGATFVDAFDIDLVDADGNVRPWNDPGNSIVVYVAMDDYMKQLFAERQPGIHFIADDAATTEAKNTWVEGANIAFETTHFSTYALTATPKPVEPEGGQSVGAGGGQGGATPAAGNQTRVGSLVNSGDSFGVAGIAFGVVALLAAAAGLTLFLRRRSE